METPRQERSIGELFGDLTREVSTLVHQEVDLAKTEMTQKATAYGKDAGFVAAGGALAYAGLLGILAAIVLLLATFLPAWIAALIVGIVVAGIGGFLAMRGLDNMKHRSPVPQQTVDTLKENAQWAKEQTT